MSSRAITYLKDYQPPAYRIEAVQLHFELEPTQTRVVTELSIIAADVSKHEPLVLDGEHLKLIKLTLDGTELSESDYQIDSESLTIKSVPAQFTLLIETELNPEQNTDLEGLFLSGENFCTQCEPHGFRRITYFIDRPDNMARFTTTLVANKERYPVLLANGNCIDSGELDNGRHYSTWEDPFLKPSYLFALVAGTLDVLSDEFITMNGRKIDLKLYVDPGQLDRATHAMESLKKSMRWDEEQYGREYDLDIFMIVAVRDFNMGAMENKGLNIFNSKYILANPATATDQDYENILMVVGHEYFHNWSGNRVTCRDWFQLSLKEGFTVFRDQTFTADHYSEAIKRIDDINLLRIHQFAEDAGPTAHPIQPQSYMEMNNFYTATVYNKGAEVVRMLRTLLNKEKFRQATDLYFDRHDGQAVTVEEFVAAMEDANDIDLKQFRLWYSQAGTPVLEVSDHYDVIKQEYVLKVAQSIPATPGQSNKQPMHIPFAIGLLNAAGHEILATDVLDIKASEQEFVFRNIAEKPVPSLLRGFSAPVKLIYDYTDEQLALLMAHDTDVFARYEAAQSYALQQIQSIAVALAEESTVSIDTLYMQALAHILQATDTDAAVTALLLTLPAEKYFLGLSNNVNPVLLHQAREILRKQIACELSAELKQQYIKNTTDTDYDNNPVQNGKRRLKNCILGYLSLIDNGECAWQQYQSANNMTDTMAAMSCLANCESPHRQVALDDFYKKWHDNPNVLDKWFMVQATSKLPGALIQVKKLMNDKAFSAHNPNAISALIGSYASANLAQFHAASGEGYQFLANYIIDIDQVNKMVAARLATPLLGWRRFNEPRKKLIKASLQKILAAEKLSKNTYEVVEKALQN